MMITYQGERVTLNGGAPSLYSIGVGLGRIARFCGHTRDHYTVLCHSMTVAELVPSEVAIYAFMHDSQEVLVSDVPTPMKTQVARNRESVLLRNIYIVHGLGWPIPEAIQEEIDAADHEALVAEAHILGHPGAEEFFGEGYSDVAGELTRRNKKRVVELLNAEVSGPLFERRFKKYAKVAGLEI